MDCVVLVVRRRLLGSPVTFLKKKRGSRGREEENRGSQNITQHLY